MDMLVLRTSLCLDLSKTPVSHENIHCVYSLEAPQWGASNECKQQCFHDEIRTRKCVVKQFAPNYMLPLKYALTIILKHKNSYIQK